MSRIGRTETRLAPLDLANMTRAEVQQAVDEGRVPSQQRGLVDLFLRYSPQGDAPTTPALAVAKARASLTERYGLGANVITAAEVLQLQAAGMRAADLARALRVDLTTR
ncbi:MAG: hypothetical protein IPJ65_03200 [Archangiaceae bacterium]|nr:hypothetical protein [Archangiaceae bacterium]